MDDKRNRIIKLKNYIESLGIIVNIGKTKARGNKGFFLNNGLNSFRIDISKNIDDNTILSTLLHEFAHYIHYINDSSLKSLDFIFENYSDDIKEELINITVQNVPKDFAKSLINLKNETIDAISDLTGKITKLYPDFKKTTNYKPLEKGLKAPAKYLLKYDCIKYFYTVYNVSNIEQDFDYLTNEQIYYIKLKSLQRKLSRINSKIRKLNNYYNQPTELWARFCEAYFTNKNINNIAPNSTLIMDKIITNKKCKYINKLYEILKN